MRITVVAREKLKARKWGLTSRAWRGNKFHSYNSLQLQCNSDTLPQLFIFILRFRQPRGGATMILRKEFHAFLRLLICKVSVSREFSTPFEHCRLCLVMIYWNFQTIWTSTSIWKPGRPAGGWCWIGRRLQVIMYQGIKGEEGTMTTMSVKWYVHKENDGHLIFPANQWKNNRCSTERIR